MAGNGSVPFRARLTLILIPAVVLVLYFIAQGNQGDVKWVTLQDRIAYASFGEFGVVGIYELRQTRPSPLPVPSVQNLYPKLRRVTDPLEKSLRHQPLAINQINNQFGDFTKLVTQGDRLYLVDPSRGFTIYDNRDIYAPQFLAKMDFYGIRDLAIFENLAFIAAGARGIYLLNLSDPQNPDILDHYDTPGYAENILPVRIETNVGDFQVQPGQVNRSEEIKVRYIAYVADGDTGLLLVDFFSDQPEFSRFSVLKTIDTPGYAHQVQYKDAFLFLADGDHGLHVFDALLSGSDPTNPRHLGTLETPGEALQVIFYHDHLFVADGEAGLFTAKFLYRGNSLEIVTTNNLQVPGGVFSLAVDQDIAVLASGVEGIHIVDIGNPSKPTLKYHLLTPGLATTGQILDAYLGSAPKTYKINQSIRDIIKELSFSLVLLVIFLVFLSPFALPYSISREFWQSADDFLKYLLGNMGRAVLVEDGQLLADPALQDYSKYRPLILDNASAGLIMDQEGSMRVVGPGTDLMQPGEALVKAADLRPSSIIYGPANEDPFQPQQSSEDEIMFRQRLRRRVQTSAQTRDGVEVVPNIIIEYKIKGEPDPVRNPFGYQSAYAHQALRQDYNADKSNVDSEVDSDLNRLPAELAVQLWRTYIGYFTLLDLFSPVEKQENLNPRGAVYGLQQITKYVNQSLKQQYVDEIDDNGSPTGGQILSEAYNELEHAGLDVDRVWIVNLRIDPQHEHAFLRRWIDSWPNQVQRTSAALDARYQELSAVNHQKAVMDFVRASINPLREGMHRYRALPEQFLFLNRSLHLLVCGTRSMGSLNQVEKFKLDQMIDWLERNLE